MTMDLARFRECKPRGYPVRHRRKVPFDPAVDLPRGFEGISREIRKLDATLDEYCFTAEDYSRLVNDAYSRNVHASTRLEGNPLTASQTRKVTKDTLGGRFRRVGFPAQEIVNHILFRALPELSSAQIDRDQLLLMHSIITASILPTRRFRKEESSVVDSSGQENFIPAPAKHVDEEMDSLIGWMSSHARAYDPVVAATVMFHEFESIHPFTDGNGRVGRTLFQTFIQTHGLPNSHLCQFEHHLLEDSELYYQMLAYVDDSQNYGALVDYFATVLLESYRQTTRDYAHCHILNLDVDDDSRRILVQARSTDRPFTIDDACGWVEGVGYESVRQRMARLVERGYLRTEGFTKGRRYAVVNPLDDVLANLRRVLRFAIPEK